MKIGITNNLIPQNIAPSDAQKVAIFNDSGQKVGTVSLGNLSRKPTGEKLYSFGALSDIHLQYETGLNDFIAAFSYLNNTEKVDFTCICGDLTSIANDETMGDYQYCVRQYASKTPVYAVSGNHESYAVDWSQNGEATVRRLVETYTGKQLYYSFTHGNDVFIMVGVCAEPVDFGTGCLQWLYETLEANRNKRCFVFQHVRPDDSCGNAYGIYANDIWNGTQSVVFENLMKHYKNVIFFHGHSHLRLDLQTRTNLANIDTKYGKYSIHIPSLVAPRTGNLDGTGRTELYAESEGYVVDVYKNHIVLRGRDFVKGEFIPIAQYCLDTTLQYIEAKTFTDSTGTIVT